VLKVYPNFPAFIHTLRHIRRKIVTTREDRQNRDKIYESIENVDLKKIVTDFESITDSEEMMKSLAKQARRHILLIYGLGVIEITVAVVGVIGIVLWFVTRPG